MMAIETTLVLLKPDAVLMGVQQQIINRYTEAGLDIVFFHKMHMTPEIASEFYQEHLGRHYFLGTVLAMTSGPCIALTLKGEDAIRLVRKIHGPTRDAPKGTIRGDFPSAGGPFNTVHASDSLESAAREIEIFFPGLKNLTA